MKGLLEQYRCDLDFDIESLKTVVESDASDRQVVRDMQIESGHRLRTSVPKSFPLMHPASRF